MAKIHSMLSMPMPPSRDPSKRSERAKTRECLSRGNCNPLTGMHGFQVFRELQPRGRWLVLRYG